MASIPSPPPIRVLIVDDHLMVRDGLRTFISIYDDLEVVGEAVDGEESVRICSVLKPDVVLMDMVMPKLDGPDATLRIKGENPQIQVIALSTFSEQELVQRAIRAGAVSYLLKDVHADRLAKAIRDAHRGLSTLDAAAAQALVQSATEQAPPDYNLTPREMEVLALIVDGMTNREISEQLIISQSTTRLHVSNILSKLGASNRTEAAAMALQNNLL
ncbi:MAG TPA: response regulator transcription factor [candidate division Zixibacteria bacterium]|nr:response regulator transcription factor [candidate division Zixibacteria bacterium]